MPVRQISLKPGVYAKVASISEHKEIQEALIQLGISYPKSVIVLIGGAAGIRGKDRLPMRKAVSLIAELAEETQSVVVDGGMQAGIMTEIGKQRSQKHFSFPLIGVFAGGLAVKQDPDFVLDLNHTHFFRVPGDNWGDESDWISKIATIIAGNKKSITVLVNGGNISKTDVEHSLRANRPTFVMRGTGRMADEIPLTGKVFPVDVSENAEQIVSTLKARLA